jgi:hypothetical protein
VSTSTPAPAAPAPVAISCPRCGAGVAPEQDWCLECGAPARTRLAPPPPWKLPLALLAIVVLASAIALAVAFASLTRDDGEIRGPATTAVSDPIAASTPTDAP